MKIGIITLFHNGNIGASLQAYALNRVLTSNGHVCEDIRYERVVNGDTDNRSNWRERFKLISSLNGLQTFAVKAFLTLTLHRKIRSRKAKFDAFEQDYIPQSAACYKGERSLAAASAEYDCFVCGSDNIWNVHKPDPSFMLSFASDRVRRLSYAAGFCVSELTAEQEKSFMPLLKRLEVISVRESNGYAALMRLLPEKNIRKDLDPTLLLTSAQWLEVADEVQGLPAQFIFCYILGSGKEARTYAKRLSQALQLPIVNIPHATSFQKEDIRFGDVELFDIGPQQFISCISKAKYVITDSYHGCVFSILFDRQFLAFRRFQQGKTSLNFRLDSLLNDLGLERRLVSGIPEIGICADSQIDYFSVHEELEKRRKSSLDYLQSL